jgi:hypothetical protein
MNVTSVKAERIRSLLNQIGAVLGYTDESGTEALLDDLAQIIPEIQLKVEQSHADGLCLDCSTLLAYGLVEPK